MKVYKSLLVGLALGAFLLGFASIHGPVASAAPPAPSPSPYAAFGPLDVLDNNNGHTHKEFVSPKEIVEVKPVDVVGLECIKDVTLSTGVKLRVHGSLDDLARQLKSEFWYRDPLAHEYNASCPADS